MVRRICQVALLIIAAILLGNEVMAFLKPDSVFATIGRGFGLICPVAVLAVLVLELNFKNKKLRAQIGGGK